MLCFSTGLPGRFSQWCDGVVARLAGLRGEPTILERWPSTAEMLGYEALAPMLDQLARLAIKAESAHIVVGVRLPDAGLHDALAETHTRFLVALDHPRVALADLLEETAAEPVLAVRAVANSCALMTRYCSLSGALMLNGENARNDPVGAVLMISQHMRFEISAAAARALLIGLEINSGARDEVVPAAAKTIGGALAGFEEYFAGAGLGRFVWNRDLFLAADQGRRISEILDLSGGARLLVHGPYLHLPAGYWTASVHFGVSQDAAQHPLLIEICADRPLASVTVQPNSPGIHVAELSFSVEESGSRALVLHVLVLNPDARGRFAFGHVVLTPAGLHHPDEGIEWQEEFNASADL